MNVASWKLHGQVRTLRTEHAEWDSDRGEWRAPRGPTTVTFRPDGQASGTESHNPDGSILRSVHTYDVAGRIVEERTWKDEGTQWEVAHSYDALGRLAQKEVLPPNLSGASISYAAQGPEFFPDDPHQLPAEISVHDAGGGIVRRVVLSRDPERRLVTEVVYFAGESLFSELQPGANEMSPEERAEILAAIKATFSDDVFCRMLYAYDVRGRLRERTMSMGTLSEERWTLEYQDRDDPIAQTTKSWDQGVEQPQREQQTRFDYQYDSRGNWTERIVRYRIGSQQEFRRSNVERRTITLRAAE